MLRVIAIVLVSLSVLSPAQAASEKAMPTQDVWLSDVHAAMDGSRDFLGARAADAASGEKLAVNLDIDNTSLASYYAPREPVLVVRRFARYAHRHGMAVFFNTGRHTSEAGKMRKLLLAAGYPVDRVCTRKPGEALVHSKKRCRASFVADGYTLVANVGNRRTDFLGGDYERSFRLPNYGNRLS